MNVLGNSRRITSSQQGNHPSLLKTLRRHQDGNFRAPMAAHNQRAFDVAARWLDHTPGPLILDHFCGNGQSTRHLALTNPEHRVIGIDKSASRLGKHPDDPGGPENYLLLRANTDDFWRLAVGAGWQAARQTLFYPNPWPKPNHLMRRVHGSPVFPELLALGGELELRSNWDIYVAEFSEALSYHGLTPQLFNPNDPEPITAFERKFRNSGHKLYGCRCALFRCVASRRV